MRVSWFCAMRALSSLTLRMSAKILVKVRNSRSSFATCSSRVGLVVALHRGDDRVLQAGFGRQRRLAVLFLSGRHEIAGQRAIGDQFAIDVARQVRLLHAAPVGVHAGRNPLEAEIGKAHAGGRNRQHDGKAEHDLGAEPQGWELEGRAATFQKSHVTPRFRSEKQASGGPAPNPVRKVKAEWIRVRKSGQRLARVAGDRLPCPGDAERRSSRWRAKRQAGDAQRGRRSRVASHSSLEWRPVSPAAATHRAALAADPLQGRRKKNSHREFAARALRMSSQ